ncbi:hypothetical protein GHK92_06285 [Nocardioides sp. dk4132]|uniref:hypothetical protein n=1 Tax=unclassified Nocardioides TaxID=2615069 RepID=UPI001295DE00|nr:MULTISPECIES: hypothetical protein [unclassified Nocardioides]MQW75474.1 hypothetical protein [Nocardioides sp. dk4132]QGA08393.1 hypothetical protein GFH29_14030 [Nocardioides sp. dk884]
MTDLQLGDLLRQAPDDLDPATADRILEAALVSGTRRRRGRRLAMAGAALSSAAVVALAVSASGLVGTDPGPRGPAVAGAPEPPPATTEPPDAPGPGEADTEGPVVPTDRAIADQPTLLAVTTDLLAGAGELSGLSVAAHETSNPSRLGAPLEGRRVDFSLDGGGASVTLQRWDGIAAVGSTLAVDPTGPAREKIATTAAEACAGAYLTSPAIECRESPAGWYSMARPSQGDAMPDTFQELMVTLYTPDGYVVRIDSYNTPGEKVGPVVAEQPVLTEAESLALASSQRWFVPR